MKVLLVIDHFGSGGAQRQMVELACGLKQGGHDVEMFVYFPKERFFRGRIDALSITVHEYDKRSRISPGLVMRLASVMRAGRFDVVLSYLKSTNIYTEVAGIISGDTKLIVSERTSRHDDSSALVSVTRRLLHRLADHVVANSETHAAWLAAKPWLRGRVSCIYNGIEIEPYLAAPAISKAPSKLELLGVGRVGPEKNILSLMRGLDRFRQQFGYVPTVRWAGRRDTSRAGRQYCAELDEYLESHPKIADAWEWLGVQSCIPEVLRRHHALVLPSHYEGLPNVVCEALAAARPVLISDVCDHSRLVPNGERGFLFDQCDAASIATAIARLAAMRDEEWCEMSGNARSYASEQLSAKRMVADYEQLFVELRGGQVRGVA